MAFYITKLIITTFLIVLISEIGKRSSLAGAILAAIPLVSILAMTWMYVDTNDSSSAVAFSNNIIWLIAPSMTLFFAFPILIKKGFGFYPSMLISIILTIFAYYSVIFLLEKFGIKT
jgi:predicted neutral ceramidase superfamily lipid hydrolase